ncbi:MAG: extracellular solute-binding protein [Anaerolineae bacterium]|nr:extracellular solute-binding protein [Anaerolineae bacterium]
MSRRSMLLAALTVIMALVALAPAMAQDKIEIQVWIAFSGARLEWAQGVAAEFNELFPQYNVVVVGDRNYEEVLTASSLAFEQGTQPAIIHFFEAGTQNARDASYQGTPQFKSIAEAIGDRTEINGLPVDFDNFVDAVRNYYTLDGSFTSFPWNTSSAIMFSNKTMLDAAGVESVPATWAEVEAACEKIMAMENAPANCITWPNYGWFFEQAVAMQGADLVNNGNGREARATETYLNSDAGIAYLNWWKDLENKGYYIYTGVQRDWNGTYNLFIQQQVAMLIYSSSDTSNATNAGRDAGFEVVASFYPHNQDVEYVGNLIGGGTLWLSNGLSTEVEDGALTFLLYLTNAENDAAWHKLTGYFPVTKAGIALLEAEGWFDENPNSMVASAQLNAAKPTSATAGAIFGNFPAIRDILTTAIEEILVNDRDVTEALNEAKELADESLAEYNLLYVSE